MGRSGLRVQGSRLWARAQGSPRAYVKPLSRFREVGRRDWALRDTCTCIRTCRQRLAVIATWAALPLEEPLAVQEATMYQEVVDILLCRRQVPPLQAWSRRSA